MLFRVGVGRCYLLGGLFRWGGWTFCHPLFREQPMYLRLSPLAGWCKPVFCAVLSVALCGAGVPRAYGISLTPGTLLGMDNTADRIIQYDSVGTVIDTLDLVTDNYVGITTIGNELFVLSISDRNVYQVDLVTGAKTLAFASATGYENMGRRGDHLLIATYSSGAVNEYTTTGVLVDSFTLGDGLTGIDSDGSRIFASQYRDPNAGDIRIYNSAGVFQNALGLGLPSSAISGMAYVAGADEFWVATGFGDDQIRRYSSSGTLLDSFSPQSTWINGLTFIPVPEPSTFAIGAIAMIGALGSGRRGGRLR